MAEYNIKQINLPSGDKAKIETYNSLTFNNSGSGAASGTTFNGNAATTISYNTIGAAASGHTHLYAGSTTAGGDANSAIKLTTARTIALGTGAIGTATSFNGTANITIPVTEIKEAYLSWGGKHFAGSYGPIDATLNPQLSANRLSGFKPAGVVIEYSTNAGSTWADYGATDAQKTALFTVSQGFCIAGPNATAGNTTSNNQLRITIDGVDGGVYTALNKYQLYVSTNGSTGCTVDIESYDYNNSTSWHVLATAIPLSGWSGWNVINLTLPGSGAFGGTNNNNHQRKIRFTFKNTGCASAYAGFILQKLYAYGGAGWATPSNMAAFGTPYSYDYAFNVTFPNKVTAPTFIGDLNGSASYLKAPNANGIETDEYGNLQHKSASTSDYWNIKSNAGSEKFKVYLETGQVHVAAGSLHIFPTTGSYTEGIRIHSYSNWSTIMLCAADNTGNSGTSANSWGVFNQNGDFYIGRNGSSNASSYLKCVNNVWSWNGTATGNINGSSTSCTGNAATATKLATARTISLTGSVTGSGSFDGSGNITISTSTNHTHSYLPLSGGTMSGIIDFQNNMTYLVRAHGKDILVYGPNATDGDFLQVGATDLRFKFQGKAQRPQYYSGFDSSNHYIALLEDVTDTKNTAGSTNSTSKLFLVGAPSQAAEPQTYSNSAVYETNGTFNSTIVQVAEKVQMKYDNTTECLNFVFI